MNKIFVKFPAETLPSHQSLSEVRFLAITGCLVLLAASATLGGLFAGVSYAKLQGLGQLVYLEDTFARLPLALTPVRYGWLRTGLFSLFFLSLSTALGLLNRSIFRKELYQLKQEIKTTWAALHRMVSTFSTAEKWAAAGLFGLVLAVRALVLLRYGFRYDEIISYMCFVREGPVVVSSYYPLPNNHVFFNLICATLNPVLPHHPLLVMRLPSYLIAAAGTALSYAMLSRFTNFWLATLVTGLFNLSPAALYYAAAGRGYYLQFVLMQLGFFAVVGLGRNGRYQRLGWLVFIGSSVLGLYTIPTYAYPLTSMVAGLAIMAIFMRRLDAGRPWLPLLLAIGIVSATTAVLYAPVGAVSGWPRLLTNQYVSPSPWVTFRLFALANVYEKIQEQFGLVRPVLLVGAGLLVGAPALLLRARLPAQVRSLGWTTWTMLVVPMALVVAQRTYPPTRAVVYLAYFGYLLAGLGGWFVVARWRGRPGPPALQWALLLALVLGAGGLRFGEVEARIRSSQHEEIQLTEAWHWLQARQPQRVMMASYQLFFYLYAVQAQQPVQLADQPVGGSNYQYLILPPDPTNAPAWAQTQPKQLVFHNDLVSIYALPTGRTPVRQGHADNRAQRL